MLKKGCHALSIHLEMRDFAKCKEMGWKMRKI